MITGALALTIALTQHPAAQPALDAMLLCLLLAVTGQFIRRGRESQDRTELLMAQLQDAREARRPPRRSPSAAASRASCTTCSRTPCPAWRSSSRARASSPTASRPATGLRGALERSAELAREGLADARQAVGALRGDRLPTVDQVGALVEDFHRDTGAEATLRIDGHPAPLPADASLALFRGAQEALTNVTRYAPGTSVAVTVRYRPGPTVLAVEDHAARRGPGCGEPGAARAPRARCSPRPAAGTA